MQKPTTGQRPRKHPAFHDSVAVWLHYQGTLFPYARSQHRCITDPASRGKEGSCGTQRALGSQKIHPIAFKSSRVASSLSTKSLENTRSKPIMYKSIQEMKKGEIAANPTAE